MGSAVKWDAPVGAQGGRLATEPEDVADFCDIDDDELMQCAPRRASRATPTLSKREMWLILRGHSLVQGGSREACATPHSTPLRRYINDGDELEIKSKVSPLPPQATKSTRAARRQAKPSHAAVTNVNARFRGGTVDRTAAQRAVPHEEHAAGDIQRAAWQPKMHDARCNVQRTARAHHATSRGLDLLFGCAAGMARDEQRLAAAAVREAGMAYT